MAASRIAATALLLALSLSPCARSASIETLIMPGPLSRAHAHLESNCSACHDRTDRNHQTALCLDCHKEIAADIRARSRYHGRMSAGATGQCRGCHAEHLGRAADINKLSESGFSHELASFPLEGAHRALDCGSCHRANVPYRKTASTCSACHKQDDTHHGALGTECASCHRSTTWRQTHFDHDKTQFPLTNKHQEVACAACHAGERYKGTPRQCVGCHRPDDVHRGNQGEACGNCHTTADWTSQKFDHARETGFALSGQHARIGCRDCHRSGNLKEPIPKDCNGCHKAADRHLGRFGAACADCHSNETWKVANFDHEARFHFALEGSHAKLDCHACHTGIAKGHPLATDCASCHRADEPHGGTLGRKCEQCHNQSDWKDVAFDHDLGSFPLLGLHTVVTCGQCHTTQRFKETAHACIGCHAQSDIHKGALGKECASCHTPNGWKLWEFDHAARTRFPLTGAHAKVGCRDCHIEPQNMRKPSMVCGTCHAGDDVHSGRFGAQCQQCHTTTTFNRPRAN